MNILFIHQNFPGQFKFLAPALVKQGHTVVAMTMQKTDAKEWQGVQLVKYSANRGTTPNVHPWVSDFETKTIRGEACFRAALQMKAQGFTPDVIISHPGWGDGCEPGCEVSPYRGLSHPGCVGGGGTAVVGGR